MAKKNVVAKGGSVGGAGMLAQRERHWGELGLVDKVERIRHILKNFMDRGDTTRRELDILSELFFEHKHLDGEIVTHPRKSSLGGSGIGRTLTRTCEGEGDNVYF